MQNLIAQKQIVGNKLEMRSVKLKGKLVESRRLEGVGMAAE